MKILICYGTRPEVIKMASLIHSFRSAGQEVMLCDTGQHEELLDQAKKFFELESDYSLQLMTENQSLNRLSSRILSSFENVLDDFNPDLVFVQGDTTTAFTISLACFHRKIDVCHVEAGLRTYDLEAPFPEEMNRQVISKLAKFHFAPTQKAFDNLINDGIQSNRIIITGNTVIDSLFWTLKKLDRGYTNPFINKWTDYISDNKPLIIVTLHRRENLGSGIIEVCNALNKIYKSTNCQIIWPLHPNPKVYESIKSSQLGINSVNFVEPLDYPSFIWLLSKASLVISDSGGIQEEAPSFGVKVLVTRESTERTEGIENNTSIIVGTNKDKIVKNTLRIIGSAEPKINTVNPYGNGNAAKKIVDFVLNFNHL